VALAQRVAAAGGLVGDGGEGVGRKKIIEDGRRKK
jgi:hypothetical protein